MRRRPPLNIFIGFDARESVAYHVLSHSILTRATGPVALHPLVQSALRATGIYVRERGPTESTDFSLTRFLCPYLSGFDGFGVFMDSDMLCRVDVMELWGEIERQCFWGSGYGRTSLEPDGHKSVLCCQHDYKVEEGTKFLGARQTSYPKKNWSSFMVFDNARCKALTPDYVNTATGLELHRFQWLKEEEVGSLPLSWNYLVGEPGQTAEPPKNIHFTLGGCWFKGYEAVEYADEWRAERDAMLGTAVAMKAAA